MLVDRLTITSSLTVLRSPRPESLLLPALHPVPPTGYWLAELVDAAFARSAYFSRRYCRRGCLRCAAAVAVAGESSELPVDATPENAERITSFAKKFLPSIGTIIIWSLSDSRSAMIF